MMFGKPMSIVQQDVYLHVYPVTVTWWKNKMRWVERAQFHKIHLWQSHEVDASHINICVHIHTHATHCKHRNSLVFIGRGLDEAALRRDLERCLVTDVELKLAAAAAAVADTEGDEGEPDDVGSAVWERQAGCWARLMDMERGLCY